MLMSNLNWYVTSQRYSSHVKTHKLLQVCKRVVTNLFTSCRQVVFTLLVPSCNKFGESELVISLMASLDLLQGYSITRFLHV